MFGILVLVIANLVLVPLALVVMTALNIGPTARPAELSLDFLVRACTSPTTWAVIGNTVTFAKQTQ